MLIKRVYIYYKSVLYLETSAVNGENICEVFKILIKDILNKIDMGSIFII